MRDLFTELERSPAIDLYQTGIRPPATEQQLEAAQARMGVSLPADLREFYREADGVFCNWQQPTGDYVDALYHGSINLLSLEEISRDWHGIIHHDDDPADAPVHRVRPVDFYKPNESAGWYQPEDGPPSMCLWSQGEPPVVLPWSFTDYFTRLMGSRGLCGWFPEVVRSAGFTVDPDLTAFQQEYLTWFPRLFGEASAGTGRA